MIRAANSDGYATLAVLLTGALLAAIVSGLLAVSRPALGLVRIGADQVAAEGLLDGGVAAAAYLLFEAKAKAADVNGVILRRDTGVARLSVVDESGRIDINHAEPELLAGLYAKVEGRSMDPEAFADRVIDWRDQDADPRPDGAEAARYAEAGVSYGPPNRPFDSVRELAYVLGLSADDFARLRPFVTTYTGRRTVDPLSASPVVLAAIPGMDSGRLRYLLQARGTVRDRERLAAAAGEAAEFLSTTESSVYRVGVAVRLTGGFTDAAEAVIVAPREQQQAGYRVAAWSRVEAGR